MNASARWFRSERSQHLGLALFAVALAIYFFVPVSAVLDTSLDASNYASYTRFAAERLQFGTEVVPMAGPFGFVFYGWVYNGDLYLTISAVPAHTGGNKGRDFYSGAVYKSTDKAETWTKLNVTSGLLFPNGIAVDPSDANRVYLACWSDIQLSDLVGAFEARGEVDVVAQDGVVGALGGSGVSDDHVAGEDAGAHGDGGEVSRGQGLVELLQRRPSLADQRRRFLRQRVEVAAGGGVDESAAAGGAAGPDGTTTPDADRRPT